MPPYVYWLPSASCVFVGQKMQLTGFENANLMRNGTYARTQTSNGDPTVYSYTVLLYLFDSSECFKLTTRENTRSCTHGNYMTLLFISQMYKTFYFCRSSIRSFQCCQITTIRYIANLNLKGFSFFVQPV